MTNMGIVLPDDGYHAALRGLCSRYGTLLIIDETHTFSAGPGGCTAAWDLSPDLLTIGKAIGGGVPCGALGLSASVEERMLAAVEADYEDTGGVGGTLAGNALSLAAMRATLGAVLTDDAWEHTIPTRLPIRRRRPIRHRRPPLERHRNSAAAPSTASSASPRATAPRPTPHPTPTSSATSTSTPSTAASSSRPSTTWP